MMKRIPICIALLVTAGLIILSPQIFDFAGVAGMLGLAVGIIGVLGLGAQFSEPREDQ